MYLGHDEKGEAYVEEIANWAKNKKNRDLIYNNLKAS